MRPSDGSRPVNSCFQINSSILSPETVPGVIVQRLLKVLVLLPGIVSTIVSCGDDKKITGPSSDPAGKDNGTCTVIENYGSSQANEK